MVGSALSVPAVRRDFFPQVDAGQMRLHVRAPPGTRIEKTQQYFAEVEARDSRLVGNDQINVMLDNIGLPYSGINIALSDSATVGPMDGEILISLKKKHTPTAQLIAKLRRELPARFAAAAILLPAGRYRRSGAEFRPAGADRCPDVRARIRTTHSPGFEDRADLTQVPGVVDSHVFQVPNAPALTVDVDRALATQIGVTQQEAAEQRAGGHQLQRPDRAEFLGRSAQQRELSAGGAGADLSHRLLAGPGNDAGHLGSGQRIRTSC